MELIRQLMHIWLGIFLLAFYVFFGSYSTLLLVALLFLLSLLFVNFCHVGWCPIGLIRLERPLLGVGLIYYMAALLFLLSYSKIYPSVFIATLIALSVGDSSATFVGKLFGKHKLFGQKTLEGTIAFFIVTSLALLAGGYPTYFAITVAFFSALIELLSPINDNIIMPLGTAFVIYLMCILPIFL